MKNNDMEKTRQQIIAVVDDMEQHLRDIALHIHANPELAFNEHDAVDILTTELEKEGFKIERNIVNLDTAFVATWEGVAEGPTIAFIAEYDALPEIGHACGHNIIGTSAIGSAVALKKACPNFQGTIQVIGTPAEEDGGGKILMSEGGVFDDVDIAMMCHPKNSTMVVRGGLACVSADFKFYGKSSHAASAPEHGISALDAMIHSFVTINSLREYMSDDVRIHGIITNGGSAPNVVPEFCEATFIIRASTREKLQEIKEKVYQAAKGSSTAVGVTCEIEEGLIYAERNDNHSLANVFRRNLESIGVEVGEPPKRGGIGSSDIGNISQMLPTIHPYIKIGESNNHTRGFTEDAKSETGMEGLIYATKALAMTAFDISENKQEFELIQKEFINMREQKE